MADTKRAIRDGFGTPCCPDCDTSLFPDLVVHPPLYSFRYVGLFRRRCVGDCRECGVTFEIDKLTEVPL